MSQKKTLKKIIDDKYTAKEIEKKLDEREVDYYSSKNKPHKVEKFVKEYLKEEEKENLLTEKVDKKDDKNDTINNKEKQEEKDKKEQQDSYPPKPYWMSQELYEKRKKNNEPLTENHK